MKSYKFPGDRDKFTLSPYFCKQIPGLYLGYNEKIRLRMMFKETCRSICISDWWQKVIHLNVLQNIAALCVVSKVVPTVEYQHFRISLPRNNNNYFLLMKSTRLYLVEFIYLKSKILEWCFCCYSTALTDCTRQGKQS